MINTVVFDIGNVLAGFHWKQYFIECGYNEEVIEKIADATVCNTRWKEWDRGVLSEAALVRESIERAPKLKNEINKFFAEFDQVVTELDYAESLLKRLKENGYQIYLLSNFSKRHYEMCAPHFRFLKYIDGKIISYEVMHLKPEPEIYQDLINRYGINPTQSVFLDDLAENIEGARLFGFHTIQVRNYLQLISGLRKLGVKI